MAIPDYNEYGFIPAGTHVVTLEELNQRYCFNKHRKELWKGLLCFLEYVRPMHCLSAIEFHGSFFRDEELPNDIDVALEFMETEPSPHLERDIFDKGLMKERFLVDVIIKEPSNASYRAIAGPNYEFSSSSLYMFRRFTYNETVAQGKREKRLPVEFAYVQVKGVLRLVLE